MEYIQFIDLTIANTFLLFLIGFVGGMISGFIGSSGAFIMTPAMMSLGVPGIIAVASNMAHKFPKALEAAYKRNKYGQVDIKLGMVMGLFAALGVWLGSWIIMGIEKDSGTAGADLYISIALSLVSVIVGILVLRDGLSEKRGVGRFSGDEREESKLVRWSKSFRVPGTMVAFKSLDTPISLLILAPVSLATGILGATIAVGGFIGIPAMIYIFGMPAMAASATELVVAFIVGMGGSLFYALDGYLDIRLSLIIVAGSLFGLQIGAISAAYARDHIIKFIMATIAIMILVSRLFYIPGYLSELNLISTLHLDTRQTLDSMGQAVLVLAMLAAAIMIFNILLGGMRQQRFVKSMRESKAKHTPSPEDDSLQLSPLARFKRFLVASDGSEFSAAAVQEAVDMAKQCGAELHLMSLVAAGLAYEAMGENILKRELEKAQTHLDEIKAKALQTGVGICETHVIHGQTIHQEILALADKLKVDVIVMGRRGRRGLARMQLGHATALVIGKAHCSVLVVPQNVKIRGRHILVATDGSRFGDAAAISATSLANIYESPVTIVSVTNSGHNDERKAEAWYAVGRAAGHMYEQGIQVNTHTLEGQPANVITELARDQNVDLIITGSHGRAGLDKVLIGSVSERILNQAPCAVLIVKSA